MKKMFYLVVILMMTFLASNNLFAQNEESVFNTLPEDTVSADVADESPQPAEPENTVSADVADESSQPSETQLPNMNDLQTVTTLLNNTIGDQGQNKLGTDKEVYVQLHKKAKMNGNHFCQRLELSILSGKDASVKEEAMVALGLSRVIGNDADDHLQNSLNQKGGGLNYGANFGYSFVIIPGYKVDNQVLLNRFGFGYSFGAIFQYDNEKDVGVTCDFLGKIGVETGFNKAVGVGVDLLFGGGKASECIVDYSEVDEKDPQIGDVEITVDTKWCGKAGAQLWLRLNFLTSSIKNFDTALFTRFVHSFRPYTDGYIFQRMEIYDEVIIWKSESWSIGFTMTYFF